jgi:hypothetical protein
MNMKTFNQITRSTLRSDFPGRKTIQSLAVFGALAALCTYVNVSAYGSPTKLSAATGGGAISADNYGSGAWLTLTGPGLGENKAGRIGTGTIVLTVPRGFEFNPGVPVTVRVTGSATAANNINHTPNSGTIAATVTSSTITITVTAGSSGTGNRLTWQNIQVRPTAGTPLARGNVARSGSAEGVPGGDYGTLTEVAGAATQLAVTRQPSTRATAGAAFGTQPQVTVRDVYGNTATSYATAVTAVETSGGNLNGSTKAQSVKPSSGVATFKGLYATNATSGVTLTFTSGSLPAVTSHGINVGPALANTLTMARQPSASAIAGTAFAQQPQVMVKDPYGNLVSDGTAVSATETSGGNLNATTSAPTANTTAGVASFSGLYVTNAATVTLMFTANGHSVASGNIMVSAAGASKLAFGQQPTTTTAGSAISPAVTVKVQDKYGNTVTTDSSGVTIGSSTTAFTPDSVLTVNAAGGVATFSAIKPTTAGTGNTLTASDGGLAGASSGPFTVNGASTGGVAASDDFNRADAADLGSNWTPLLGASPQPFLGHLVITNNQAGPNAQGVDCLSYWSANTFSDDQYSQAVIPKVGYYTTVIVRADSTQNRFYEGYVTATGYGIAKYWDGSWSPPLVSGIDGIWHDGDTVRLEVTGSAHPMTLTMYHNGSPVLTWTSSSALDVKTGGSPGIGIGDRDWVGLRLDNWEGGDLGTVSATRLVLTGSGTQTAGDSQELTITAKDASGNTDTTYTGSKSLVFSGAGSSANPVTVPTVTDSSGTAIRFGSATAINFNNGVATVSGGANGAMTLYKAETATISVTDGVYSSGGTDRLTVTVSARGMSKFALSLTSPQVNGAAFTGVNTLTAQDDYGNTVNFDASANPVTITANAPLSGTVSGLSGGNQLTSAGDFSSGVANLTALGMKYTGSLNTGTFTASTGTGGYTGNSGSVTITQPGTSASDDFNRANASDLGGNWTALSGSGNFGHLVLLNNQASPNTAGVDCYSYWSHDVFAPDQYSQIVIPTLGSYVAVIVRASSAQDSFYQGYVSGANAYGISVRWNGSWIPLVTGSAAGWQAGQTLTLEAVGSNPVTLTLYQNGNPVLTTSTSVYVIAVGSPGLGSANLPLDNWQGGN